MANNSVLNSAPPPAHKNMGGSGDFAFWTSIGVMPTGPTSMRPPDPQPLRTLFQQILYPPLYTQEHFQSVGVQII